MTSANNRLGWVDGAKGLSAIIVVLCHTLVTIDGVGITTSFRPTITHNLWDGNFAVSVFIILSTILICHSIEMHRDQLMSRYRYLVLKRYFRLLIPVGTVILIMYFANLLGLFYAEEYGIKTGNQWLTGITESLLHLPGVILFAPLGGAYTILRVTWMLPYVCLGTMWVVVLDLLLSNRQLYSQLILLFFCTYIAWKCDFYYVNVVFGYALYNFMKDISTVLLLKYVMGGVGLFLFVISDYVVLTDEGNMIRAICFVTMLVTSGILQRAFSFAPLMWIGKISMSIYLLHLLVIYSVTCRMSDSLPHTVLNQYLMILVTIVGTIFIAYLFTEYVEPKLNKITDIIVGKLK